MISIKRDSCPSNVPLPEGVEGKPGYGDMEGIEVSWAMAAEAGEVADFRFGTRRLVLGSTERILSL